MAGGALVQLEVERLDNDHWGELVQLVCLVATLDGRAEVRPEVIVVTENDGNAIVRAEDVMVGVFGMAGVLSLCAFATDLGEDPGGVRVHARDVAFEGLEEVLQIQRQYAPDAANDGEFVIRPGQVTCRAGEASPTIEHFVVVLEGQAVAFASEVLRFVGMHVRGMETPADEAV